VRVTGMSVNVRLTFPSAMELFSSDPARRHRLTKSLDPYGRAARRSYRSAPRCARGRAAFVPPLSTESLATSSPHV